MNTAIEIVETLKSFLSSNAPLHEPRFWGNEKRYLNDCIESGFVSSVGPFVERFEQEVANFTGAQHVVATVNGTTALQVALLVAGLQPNDEILVPSLTFVATANAVKHAGGVPHFVDVSPKTLGIDHQTLNEWLFSIGKRTKDGVVNSSTGRVIRGLVPMHTFGHSCEMDALSDVCREHGLFLVEDAAEALGTTYKGRHTGTLGDLGILSFNGNKILTTGGGGAILTNNSQFAVRAKHLTTTAKIPHRWEFLHDEVGFNFRLPNINAALGCAQLEQLEAFIESKRKLYEVYSKLFRKFSGVQVLKEPPDSASNYWLQTLVLEEQLAHIQMEVLSRTNEIGIQTRPVWRPLHTLPPYVDCPRAPLPATESFARRLINIPSSAGLA